MKTSIVILFLSVSLLAYCQKRDEVLISLPELGVFYTGYDNSVELSFRNNKIDNVVLECEGCDFIEKISSASNQWVVRVDSIVPVKLIAKDGRGKQVAESLFKVFAPPLPIVYLDGVSAQSVISTLPTIIHLKLEPSVPLNMGLAVKSWTIKIENKVFLGFGGQITEEVLDHMKFISSGILRIDLKFYSPFGIKEVKEMFEFTVE